MRFCKVSSRRQTLVYYQSKNYKNIIPLHWHGFRAGCIRLQHGHKFTNHLIFTTMYEKLSKQEFISKATKRIELRKQMTDFRENVFVEILNKFNGKVYNKRFRTELSKMLPSDLWYISESYNPVDEIKIVGRIDRYNYSDTEDLHIKLVLNKEGRIMAKETLEQDFTVSWLQSFKNYTESIGDSIENYDRYFQMSKEIESMLQNYGDNVPFYFRDNITGFRSYILK